MSWANTLVVMSFSPEEKKTTGVRLSPSPAVSSTSVWAVGNTTYGTPGTLIEHYIGGPCPPTLTPIPPRCPGERFTDVCPGDYFYQHVLDLNDLGIIAGYNTAPPCALC